MTDLLLDETDDIQFDVNGELIYGDTTLQEVGLIARINKGELRNDPLLGPNLIELIKANGSKAEIKQRLKLHLERDEKNYTDFENLIEIILKDYAGNNIT